MFRVDRILPVPQETREALIKLYFEDRKEAQEEVVNNEANRDCLVRV